MIAQFLKTLNQLGLNPKDIPLYHQAFTHRSYLNEVKELTASNERLEFLGDAILEYITSYFLFKKHPLDPEGKLTALRSYIVKTDSLAKAALQLNLGSYLLLSKGEEVSGGRGNVQILANTYEAVLGAIFLDLGLSGAEKFVNLTLLPLFSKEIESGPPKDSKSLLQEIVQERNRTSPKYKIISTSGPDHAKQFEVGVCVGSLEMGKGFGPSKQHAEEEAATKALAKLTK